MYFYRVKETQLNYRRNEGAPQKIAFNLITYFKKSIKSIKKIDLLSESCRKLLLSKQKYCLGVINNRYLINIAFQTIQKVDLGVKMHARIIDSVISQK